MIDRSSLSYGDYHDFLEKQKKQYKLLFLFLMEKFMKDFSLPSITSQQLKFCDDVQCVQLIIS
jgi:hypothetical protein